VCQEKKITIYGIFSKTPTGCLEKVETILDPNKINTFESTTETR